MHMLYLNLPRMVGYDEAKQYDGGQADQTLQGQGVHGALQREQTHTSTRPLLKEIKIKCSANIIDNSYNDRQRRNDGDGKSV